MIITGHDYVLANWVADKAGIKSGFEKYTAIGSADKDGNLMGATVFTNYHPEHGIIEMSSAAINPKWLSKDMIRAIFSYPFDQLGCQMVVLRVSETNTRMLNIARRFDMSEYTIPRLRGKDEAEVIFTYTDDQWRTSRYRSAH